MYLYISIYGQYVYEICLSIYDVRWIQLKYHGDHEITVQSFSRSHREQDGYIWPQEEYPTTWSLEIVRT